MSDDFDLRLRAELRALADAVPTGPIVWRPATDRPRRMGTRTRTALPIGSLLVGGLVVLALVWAVPRLGPTATLPSATAPSTSATPASGAFSPTGTMAAARSGQTATLLRDGRVLIAGGADSEDALASAELYDPATGTFTSTGSMTAGRWGHTATLLPDGRVLIAGGSGSTDRLASAELYDPKSGTFSNTGSMTTPRLGHTATLLSDGRVLVAGGEPAVALVASAQASAELYDPATGTFGSTGSMTAARRDHTATLLPDGRVLIAGGADERGIYGNSLSSAELYDPKAGTFSITGSLTMGRFGQTATLLPDGRVLVAGGTAGAVDVPWSQASAEVYDPATGTFGPTGSMTAARRDHTATLLPDGRVLIAGGADSGTLASAELYDPATGTSRATGSMTVARRAHTATLLPDGRVMVAGGWGNDPLASAELYRP